MNFELKQTRNGNNACMPQWPVHEILSASTSVKDSPAVNNESIDLPGTAWRRTLTISTLNELQHFIVSVHGEGLLTD